MDILSGFDFSLLDEPDFKEDSVREEIVVPLLKALGYTASGTTKIIRSKSLTHPFVYLGSKKYAVKIIPDYILVVNEDHKWILDAKAPNENILKGKNPEQAFSYAMHPEVRAFRYGLCNGHYLTVFDVNRSDPVAVVAMREIAQRFSEVARLLSPEAFTKPEIFDYHPDLGLYYRKLGYPPGTDISFIPIKVPFIVKVEDDLYSIFLAIKQGEDSFALSFDFDKELFRNLIEILPEEKAELVENAMQRQPYQIEFQTDIPEVVIHAKLGQRIYSNEDESYCPLEIVKFSKL